MDKLYAQGVKPSAALRAYDSCKETNLWMQDELYLSGWEIEEISKTLTKYEDEVNTLVEKAASERTARHARPAKGYGGLCHPGKPCDAKDTIISAIYATFEEKAVEAELSECDIDPEAVSVDSEAHDMENGRDGLDGNATEKDAPEKDDRDAQPPVDTDNR